MSCESDLRALLPETLSDEAAFSLVEALYAMAGALEGIYFAQIRRHLASLDRSVQPDLFDGSQIIPKTTHRLSKAIAGK